jgi:hypothetical protein
MTAVSSAGSNCLSMAEWRRFDARKIISLFKDGLPLNGRPDQQSREAASRRNGRLPGPPKILKSKENMAAEITGLKIETVERKDRLYIIGWALSILTGLALLASASMKFAKPEPGFSEGMQHIGWEPARATTLGVIEALSTLIYLIPKTAILGAVLLAAYLGGAVATHVRVGDPFMAPVVIGFVAWLALWLREPRLRALTPIRA